MDGMHYLRKEVRPEPAADSPIGPVLLMTLVIAVTFIALLLTNGGSSATVDLMG